MVLKGGDDDVTDYLKGIVHLDVDFLPRAVCAEDLRIAVAASMTGPLAEWGMRSSAAPNWPPKT